MAELSDAQLVRRCCAGEAEAWNELVERFSRYVYAIAVSGFRFREHDAEDVFQEVFVRVYDRLWHLVDPRQQLVDVVVLRVQVATGERVVASAGELADELRREPRRRPRRVLRDRRFGQHQAGAEEEDGDPAGELVRQGLPGRDAPMSRARLGVATSSTPGRPLGTMGFLVGGSLAKLTDPCPDRWPEAVV